MKPHLTIILHIHTENLHYFSTEHTQKSIIMNLHREDIKITGFIPSNNSCKEKKTISQEKNLTLDCILKDKSQNTPNDL